MKKRRPKANHLPQVPREVDCPVSGKLSFVCRADTEVYMRWVRRRAGVSSPHKAYRCSHCGHWHMTSSLGPDGRQTPHKRRKPTAAPALVLE